MKLLTFLVAISFATAAHSQKKKEKSDENQLLAELSADICNCIKKVDVYAVKKTITDSIHSCIDAKATTYQVGQKLRAANLDQGKLPDTIRIGTDKESNEYRKYYFEMERYLMANCPELRTKLTQSEQIGFKSGSNNPTAIKFYNQGQDESKKENYKKALDYYKKAVEADPEFAFAYDNLGLTYRRLEDYDNAVTAYEKSLAIDPYGRMPLQNLPIAYQYAKEYDKAISAYQRMADVDGDNPEIFYGMGQVNVVHLKNYEVGLDQLCRAYVLYVEAKSPYRSDAEKLIQFAFAEMKAAGKEKEFKEILARNGLNPN